ncbi:MAG TPA: MFS transporter [Dehalococcoidia bacterium]|nr:MFS transporter [Dehalococcoidia bacterium]
MDEVDEAPGEGPAAPTAPRPRGTFTSLALPQFRLLLAGTASSQVAGWMEEVARGWLVLQLTHSPFQLGLLGFIRGFSQLLMSPVAGLMADRLDRRRLAALTQVVPALVALGIGLLVTMDRVSVWHLYVLVAVAGAAGAVNIPTRQVLVYDVVGSEYLTNAIGLNAVVSNLARIAAPAVGGLIIGTVGIDAAFYGQVVFFALATGATLALRPLTHVEAVRTPLWQGLRDGVGYVRGDRTVLRLVLLNVVPNVLIYPYVALMPVFAADVLHVGSWGYGVLLTGVGFGSIPGGLLVASMTRSAWKGRTMGAAAVLYMSMVALFAASSWFPLSFAILMVGGVGWSMMVTLNQTLLQLNLSDAYRGRVLSLYTMAGGLTPFGNLAMGAAASRFGVQEAVVAFALVALALAATLSLGSARIRRL